MKTKKEIILTAIISVCILTVIYFISGYFTNKHMEVRMARATVQTTPHVIGSNCLIAGEGVAILKKYLDNGDHWLYDVMVLDAEGKETPINKGVSHKSIGYCVE